MPHDTTGRHLDVHVHAVSGDVSKDAVWSEVDGTSDAPDPTNVSKINNSRSSRARLDLSSATGASSSAFTALNSSDSLVVARHSTEKGRIADNSSDDSSGGDSEGSSTTSAQLAAEAATLRASLNLDLLKDTDLLACLDHTKTIPSTSV
jgi:hypothetical protein